MRRVIIVGCIILVAMTLFRCSNSVSLDKVYGKYVSTYPFGTSTLTLNKDGTFIQRVDIKNETPLITQGKWIFHSDRSAVAIDGFVEVDDGSGKLKNGWRTLPPILIDMGVEILWFKTVIGSASDYPYVKQ